MPHNRLLSWEFAVYYLAIAAAAQKFTSQGYRVSQQVLRKVTAWEQQRFQLRPGWILSLSQDLSDIQWRVFREGICQLATAMLLFVLLSNLVQRRAPQARIHLCLLSGLALAGHLHGSAVVFPLGLSMLSFCLAKSSIGRPWIPWLLSCFSLLAARLLEGGSFAALSKQLAFLDSHKGPVQWHVSYNLLVLRQISFAMDYHWACKPATAAGQLHPATKPAGDNLKTRQKAHLPASAYSLTIYLAYIFYPPLYLAGPILTFNSFASQVRQPMLQKPKQLALYAGRLAAALLLMEVMTHTLYFNSIAKHKLWQRYAAELHLTALHVGMTGFWVLVFMWLKFLIIWRFFRMWAWIDGVQAPENMLRCICNNYDIEGFWKGWHASYNQWLVRYMYIPLGGSSTRILNVWLIFTFVALWHDLEWHMLGWAWLTCLFFLPEMALKWAVQQRWAQPLTHKWYFRHFCAAAGCCNIIALMVANLVGFVVGVDGIMPVMSECLTDMWFLAGVVVVCYSAVQVMFEIRGLESKTWLGSAATDAHSAKQHQFDKMIAVEATSQGSQSTQL